MRKRPALLVLLPALVLAACSGDPGAAPPGETAAAVISRVDEILGAPEQLDPGEVVVPEGCRLEIELDEYGFETEIVVCDEPAGPGDTSTTSQPGEDPPGTTTPPSTAAPPDLEDWAGSAEARLMARRLRRAIVEQSGCESPADLIELENQALAAPIEIRGPLLAGIDDLRRGAAFCNADVGRWQEALEAALDDFEAVAALLEEAADE